MRVQIGIIIVAAASPSMKSDESDEFIVHAADLYSAKLDFILHLNWLFHSKFTYDF